MKILVCYDDSDLSQKLMSSAKQYVDKHFVNKINDVCFLWINISKQKFEKFIDKEENHDISVVFIPESNKKEIFYAQNKKLVVETYGFKDYQFKETGYGLKKQYQLQYRFLKYIYSVFSSIVIKLNKTDCSFELIAKEQLTPQLLNNPDFIFFNSKDDLKKSIKTFKKEREVVFNDEISFLKKQLNEIENKKKKCMNNIYLIEKM